MAWLQCCFAEHCHCGGRFWGLIREGVSKSCSMIALALFSTGIIDSYENGFSSGSQRHFLVLQ